MIDNASPDEGKLSEDYERDYTWLLQNSLIATSKYLEFGRHYRAVFRTPSNFLSKNNAARFFPKNSFELISHPYVAATLYKKIRKVSCIVFS